jgi:hypothetical protein
MVWYLLSDEVNAKHAKSIILTVTSKVNEQLQTCTVTLYIDKQVKYMPDRNHMLSKVFRIYDILVWIHIRILGSVHLIYGSGSCSFSKGSPRCQQKLVFFQNCLTYYFLSVLQIRDVHPVSRILIITHTGTRSCNLGFRIQKEQQKRTVKKISSHTFFVATNITKLKII